MSSTTSPNRAGPGRWAAETAEAIDTGIRRAEQLHATIDTSTARAIALCLGEPGGQLRHFGLTGTLHRTEALLEIEWLDVNDDTRLWAGALWDYLDQPHPPRRQVLAPEGRAA